MEEKEVEKFVKQNWFKMGILVALLAVSLAVGNYYFNYIPARDNRLETEKNARAEKNASALQGCLDQANQTYFSDYDRLCQNIYNTTYTIRCVLIPTVVASLDKQLEINKNTCIAQYPQN